MIKTMLFAFFRTAMLLAALYSMHINGINWITTLLIPLYVILGQLESALEKM